MLQSAGTSFLRFFNISLALRFLQLTLPFDFEIIASSILFKMAFISSEKMFYLTQAFIIEFIAPFNTLYIKLTAQLKVKIFEAMYAYEGITILSRYLRFRSFHSMPSTLCFWNVYVICGQSMLVIEEANVKINFPLVDKNRLELTVNKHRHTEKKSELIVAMVSPKNN